MVHDEPSHVRHRFKLRQLWHGGQDPALTRRGQALRFRRPRLRFTRRQVIVFGSAVAALYTTDHRGLAIAFAVIVLLNSLLVRL